MPTFILAGYQQSLANHVRSALQKGQARLRGWNYQLLPGLDKTRAEISTRQVDQLLTLADKHDGAHIFGVDGYSDRVVIQRKLAEHFRFRWIQLQLVTETGRGVINPLLDALEQAIVEEDYWRGSVMPSDSASPLILPKIFKANRSVETLWRLSESYNNLGHLEAATKMITRFTREHRHRVQSGSNSPWLCDDDWEWEDDGPRHGQPEFPDDWKYSYRLPDGFHYDVSPHNNKNKTHFKDKNGRSHALPSKKNYVNVTAHGEIRGFSG